MILAKINKIWDKLAYNGKVLFCFVCVFFISCFMLVLLSFFHDLLNKTPTVGLCLFLINGFTAIISLLGVFFFSMTSKEYEIIKKM